MIWQRVGKWPCVKAFPWYSKTFFTVGRSAYTNTHSTQSDIQVKPPEPLLFLFSCFFSFICTFPLSSRSQTQPPLHPPRWPGEHSPLLAVLRGHHLDGGGLDVCHLEGGSHGKSYRCQYSVDRIAAFSSGRIECSVHHVHRSANTSADFCLPSSASPPNAKPLLLRTTFPRFMLR